MAAESLVQMLEEIAVGLKAGDEEIYGWLREQLKECGASETWENGQEFLTA